MKMAGFRRGGPKKKQKGIPPHLEGKMPCSVRRNADQKSWTASRMETIQVHTLWNSVFGMMRFSRFF